MTTLRWALAAILGLALVSLPTLAQDKPDKSTEKPRQQAKKFDKEIKVRASLGYLLYLPESYDKGGKDWPLLIFLHGAGETGTDIEKVKMHGPPKLIEKKKDFPFIVVSPQTPQRGWNVDALNGLLDDLLATHKIDKSRVYLTGLSMGGFGTWSWAAANPERFAAIAPICGGGNPAQANRLKHVPTWCFHGAKDAVVPLRQSGDMIEAIKKAGGEPKFTVYPEANHDSWTETYDNPELYDWLLKQKREMTSFNGTWKGDKEGYGGNLICHARRIGENTWAAAFSGYCGRDYVFDIELKGKKASDSDKILFEGDVDLGEKNGGKYHWTGHIVGDVFTGQYLTDAGKKGEFSMKLEKK